MPRKHWVVKSGSKWTSEETEMLNVQNAVKPWRQLLRPEFRNITCTEDPVLQVLLQHVELDVKNMNDAYTMGLFRSGHFPTTSLAKFYDKLRKLVQICAPVEQDEVGDIPPTPADVILKRAPSVRVAKDRPSTSASDSSIPKSSSSNSLDSVSSADQATVESTTEIVFMLLLNYVLDAMLSFGERPLLEVKGEHMKFEIKLARGHTGCTVINDGAVVVYASGSPVINIECKSRNGSTGLDIYEKLFAQEYAEMLALMLTRMNTMLRLGLRQDGFRVVYSFSIHHRRAYLTKVHFSEEYLLAIVDGILDSETVLVERSEQSYRLDKADELRELITMIYSLYMQLQQDVANKVLV